MGRKTREVEGDANSLSLNFYVLLALSSQLSVFLRSCIMNTLLHFLSRQSCRSLGNVCLDGRHIPFLGLIKRSYHGWLSMMTSSDGPFQPCLGPRTLSPPLSATFLQLSKICSSLFPCFLNQNHLNYQTFFSQFFRHCRKLIKKLMITIFSPKFYSDFLFFL